MADPPTSSDHRGGAPKVRFLTLPQVADELAASESQVYALVRNGDLPAIKLGGRGAWRVERQMLEAYIARMYEQTAAFVADHPFGGSHKDEDET